MENSEFEKLAKTIGNDIATIYKGDTVSALWPFTVRDLCFYVGNGFSEDILDTLNKLRKKYSYEEIAEIIKYPSKITDYFGYTNDCGLSNAEKTQLATHFFEILKRLRVDPLCTDRTNKLLKVEKGFFDKELKKSSLENTNKLSFLLFMYLELIYPTAMRLGYEFHGPYELKDKKIWIKEYFNLKNQFADETSAFPFNHIVIIEEINKYPKVDFFNHLLEPPEKIGSALIVDGNVINDISKIVDRVQTGFIEVSGRVKDFSRKDWLKFYSKGLTNSYFCLKEILGIKFKVPQKICEKIDNENFIYNVSKALIGIKEATFETLAGNISKSFYKNAFGL